jgi:hypothetical protein
VAVYIPQEQRRRRSTVAIASALALGLVLGVLLGRVTAPSLSSQVEQARAAGQRLASALRALPLEYEQAVTGSEGESTTGIRDAVNRTAALLPPARAKAPWLGPTATRQAHDAVAAVQRAVASKVDPASFRATAEKAAATVEDVFDVTSTTAGA